MEIMQATAKMQHTQTAAPKSSSPEMQTPQVVQPKQEPAEVQARPSRTDNQREIEDLVMKLNRSLNPFNTSLRFGFDNSSEDFYVSVIDTKTNDMIRRFPVEEAQFLLPKMQELNGLLFDQTV